MTAHDDDVGADGTPNASDSMDLPAPITELAELYPARAEHEWQALVAGIVRAAAPELARRRSERGLVRSILRWSRPVGVAAAAVLLIGAIGLAATNDAEAMTATSSFAEVVDREPASTLLATDRPPSASDLERALDADSFQQVGP
ncbi:MAG TPA: hypothetical protein VK617_02150 [Gemmatimonadaceae bacterium]|nr:hypothetical protein [Gemmatimonadaceae bacterium]